MAQSLVWVCARSTTSASVVQLVVDVARWCHRALSSAATPGRRRTGVESAGWLGPPDRGRESRRVLAPQAGTEEAMKQAIEIEIRQLSTSWLAVAVRKGDLPLLQVQAPSEREATQEIYLRLRELRDGIDAVLEAL